MSTTASKTISPAGSNRSRDRGDPIWLFLVFGIPFLFLASCLVIYLLIEHAPDYLKPEMPAISGANTWSVIQKRFVQREDGRISVWQGEIKACEVPSNVCTGLSNVKVLTQITSQYDEKDWEMVWSSSDWRSHLCYDSTLVSHKVDVVIRRPWLGRYVPTLCVGVARSGQSGYKIMITTINPSFLSGWE